MFETSDGFNKHFRVFPNLLECLGPPLKIERVMTSYCGTLYAGTVAYADPALSQYRRSQMA